VLLTADWALAAFGQDQNLGRRFATSPSWVIRNDQIEIAVTQLGRTWRP